MSADSSNYQSTRQSAVCAELMALMREQEQLCGRLLELSTGERVAVLHGRVEDLEASTREKARLIERMERCERERRKVAATLAFDLDLPANASLADLAAGIGGETERDLLHLRHRVVDLFGSLKESNEGNLFLMRKSLDLVRDSIRQFRRSVGPGDTYTPNGRASVKVKNNLVVDCHA